MTQSQNPPQSDGRGGSDKRSTAPAPKRATYRLFIAAYPPVALAEAWLAHASEIVGLPEHRLLPVEQVHVTLQFLGDRPKAVLPMIIECANVAWGARSPITVHATSTVLFPSEERPSVLATELSCPASLRDLKACLDGVLSSRSMEEATAQAEHFRPHCTLARFGGRPVIDVVPRIAPLGERMCVAFEIRSIAVVRSVQESTGVVHDRIAVLPFGLNGAEDSKPAAVTPPA